ncbi:MAG TPA: hypothetical protein VK421_07240 [Pyrinomonadaceae bacterium]|nr:hypothetical protein [Pyrinomonadaceae bacterium]
MTGFQINNSYPALVEFIDWAGAVAKEDTATETELIINGDIVDFLSEDDFGDGLKGAQIWTADEAQAVLKLRQIALRTRGGDGRGVFDALRDFLAAGNRLTLLLGNHDVELSLPRVREELRDLLVGGDARMKFIYDGEAYTPGRVLIEHGNRYDRWNMIDHSALRQERSVRSRRLEVDEAVRQKRYFVPPAGTHLVIHFMNRIKARYRFIDLLKPETNAMLPLFLALEPDLKQYLEKIVNASPIVKLLLKHGLDGPVSMKWAGDMSAAAVEAAEEITLDKILLDTFDEAGTKGDARLFGVDVSAASGDLSATAPGGSGLEFTAGDLSVLSSLREQVAAAQQWFVTRAGQLKGTYESASTLLRMRRAETPEERYEQLHAALRRLNQHDRSFRLDHEESNYLDAARKTAADGDFDVILYGHTHLPKKIKLEDGAQPRWYLNTGTWCDVIRLPDAVAGDYDTAKPVITDFADALGRNDYSRFVRRYLSYVELLVDPEGRQRVAEPQLYSYCGRGRERSAPLTEAAR